MTQRDNTGRKRNIYGEQEIESMEGKQETAIWIKVGDAGGR